MTVNSPSWHPAAFVLLWEDGRASSGRRKKKDFGTFWTVLRCASAAAVGGELQHLPDFGAIPILDTP